MASIRSISTSKPSDNLSDQRLNRASTTSSIPHAQRKLPNNKSPSIIVSTIRRKSPRMSLKKDPVGSMTSSSSNQPSNDNHDVSVEQMASMKLYDLSPKRSRSKTANNFTARPHFDKDISYEEQPIDRSELASARSSLTNNIYTLESFEPIRTVGTGKNILNQEKKKNP
jgi:hypothetical protein